MKFTLPSLLLGYNQAITIVNKFEEGKAYIEDIRQALIVGVHEYYSRAWAIYSLDTAGHVDSETKIIQEEFKDSFIDIMKLFVLESNNDETPICREVKFSFNSKTGIAEGTFEIPVVVNDNIVTDFYVEKTGDMLRSDFITITDRNYPGENNYIEGKKNCTKISTDYPNGLQNVLITFKNMYY